MKTTKTRKWSSVQHRRRQDVGEARRRDTLFSISRGRGHDAGVSWTALRVLGDERRLVVAVSGAVEMSVAPSRSQWRRRDVSGAVGHVEAHNTPATIATKLWWQMH